MTAPTLPGLELPVPVALVDEVPAVAPRPGSRVARMAVPLSKEVLYSIAAEYGVCIRPLALRRIDTETGQTEITEIPCGATLASKCPPCAEKNRRDRLQQLRQGWHLDTEPEPKPDPSGVGEDVRALVELRAHYEFERAALMFEKMAPELRAQQLAELDAAIVEVTEAITETGLRGTLAPETASTPRRARSTKRRQDTPDLPSHTVDSRTVGRVFAGTDGTTHRPSMLLTVTLGSYGPVHTPRRPGRPDCECGTAHHPDDPKVGMPVDPATYDYRRAALDSIHFAKLLDRLWQNLRRSAGFKLQYGGCVELQRRLAPHGHFAVRGTLPRALVKAVAAATYHQVWWPQHDQLVYSPDRPPVWNEELEHFTDPVAGEILLSWDEALDLVDADPDAQPAHVVTCGRIDPRGIKGGTKDAERSIRYITKYVTKDITDHVTPTNDHQRAHFDRMHAELSVLPCSTTCANWLLYGIEPENAHARLKPGHCRGKVHQRQTLGFTGRRVLISRQWSNKTLTDIKADNRAWVRALLNLGNEDQVAAADAAPPRRFEYELAREGDPDLPTREQRIMTALSARMQWKQQLEAAKLRQEELSATSATERGEGGG